MTLLEDFRHKEIDQLKNQVEHLMLLSFIVEAVVAGSKRARRSTRVSIRSTKSSFIKSITI